MNHKAQITIEYFVLFMAVAAVTLLSISALYPRIRHTGEVTFNKIVNKVLE